MQHLDWDDLRYAHAVAAGGSLAAAARALRVNHTTVMRRIAALEARLSTRIFERLASGYVPTPAGEELIAATARIEELVTGLERRLAGADLAISGTVRLTTTDTLAVSLLPAVLAALRRAHPALLVEVATSNVFLNLTRREADVALRPADDPPPDLFGRRIGDIGFAVYGLPDLSPVGSLGGLPWIGIDDTLSATAAARWMRTALPDAAIVARAGSFVSMRLLAEAGLGAAALPCYLGDASPSLVRLSPPVEAMRTGLWILTHEDLRRTARIRTVMDFLGAELSKMKPLISGG